MLPSGPDKAEPTQKNTRDQQHPNLQMNVEQRNIGNQPLRHRPLRHLLSQLLQQRLRVFQVERVEAFRKPAIDWSQQFAGLLQFPLIAPEPSHAHRGAQFSRFCLLLTRNFERPVEIFFGFRDVRFRR